MDKNMEQKMVYRVQGLGAYIIARMENQMEKNREHEMEAAILLRV